MLVRCLGLIAIFFIVWVKKQSRNKEISRRTKATGLHPHRIREIQRRPTIIMFKIPFKNKNNNSAKQKNIYRPRFRYRSYSPPLYSITSAISSRRHTAICKPPEDEPRSAILWKTKYRRQTTIVEIPQLQLRRCCVRRRVRVRKVLLPTSKSMVFYNILTNRRHYGCLRKMSLLTARRLLTALWQLRLRAEGQASGAWPVRLAWTLAPLACGPRHVPRCGACGICSVL